MHSATFDQRNWGRWGPEDERGAANLLTGERVRDAAQLVTTGRVYQMGLEISALRSLAHPGRGAPQHFMTLDGGDYAAGYRPRDGFRYADDTLLIGCHGTTHVDALAHCWSDDQLFNGHPSASVRSYGATRCGIENLGAVAARGVLLDVASHLGVDHVDPERPITAVDIVECARAQSVQLRPGDFVAIRTGWQRVFDQDRARYLSGSPGIDLSAAEYLVDRDVFAVGSDTMVVEVHSPASGYSGESPGPVVHLTMLWSAGIYLLELLQLEDLATDGVHEFLFVLAPLRITGGTGSPVNPVAIA